jgi:uncharacterized membrane protein
MRTPASIGKHPVHPMLVVFPIGLWIFSLVCDLIGLVVDAPQVWFTVAFFTMVGGLIGALLAAVPGLSDLLYYKGGKPPLKRIALTHMAINLSAVALYIINVVMRIGAHGDMRIPILLSLIGVAMIGVSGWLGGQMVHVYGVGVQGRE